MSVGIWIPGRGGIRVVNGKVDFEIHNSLEIKQWASVVTARRALHRFRESGPRWTADYYKDAEILPIDIVRQRAEKIADERMRLFVEEKRQQAAASFALMDKKWKDAGVRVTVEGIGGEVIATHGAATPAWSCPRCRQVVTGPHGAGLPDPQTGALEVCSEWGGGVPVVDAVVSDIWTAATRGIKGRAFVEVPVANRWLPGVFDSIRRQDEARIDQMIDVVVAAVGAMTVGRAEDDDGAFAFVFVGDGAGGIARWSACWRHPIAGLLPDDAGDPFFEGTNRGELRAQLAARRRARP
jgi:hypothetical protein